MLLIERGAYRVPSELPCVLQLIIFCPWFHYGNFFSLFAKIIFSNNVLVRGDEHSYLIGQLTNKNPVNSKTIPCLPKFIVWSIDFIQYSLYTRCTFLTIFFLLCAFFADFSCLFFVSIFWRKKFAYIWFVVAFLLNL